MREKTRPADSLPTNISPVADCRVAVGDIKGDLMEERVRHPDSLTHTMRPAKGCRAAVRRYDAAISVCAVNVVWATVV